MQKTKKCIPECVLSDSKEFNHRRYGTNNEVKNKNMSFRNVMVSEIIVKISSTVEAFITSKYSDFSLTVLCLVITRIKKHIAAKVITGNHSILNNIKLVDSPSLQISQKIDLLINATY